MDVLEKEKTRRNDLSGRKIFFSLPLFLSIALTFSCFSADLYRSALFVLDNRYFHFGQYFLLAEGLVKPLEQTVCSFVLILVALLLLVWIGGSICRKNIVPLKDESYFQLISILSLVFIAILLLKDFFEESNLELLLFQLALIALPVLSFISCLKQTGSRKKGARFVSCLIIIVCFIGWLTALKIITRGSSAPKRNVVFIGIDTLRADHLGSYGYGRPTSPVIDKLASEGTLFENCVASIPRTTQSLASIITSKEPYAHGVRYLLQRMQNPELSIAEILKNAGYQTLAVLATGIVKDRLNQGFDKVIDTKDEFTARETADFSIKLLEEAKGSFFLFSFFRDPHMPFTPEKIHFGAEYMGRFTNGVGYLPDKGRCAFENSFSQEEKEHAVDLYDSEIASMDNHIGRLIDAIKKKDPNTLIVFFADHGESLGEHDYYYDHGDLLYQPGLKIPFIISGLKFKEKRISQTVRSIDIMPTVLSGLGISVPNNSFQGVDLRKGYKDLPAFSESGHALVEEVFTSGKRVLTGLKGRLRSLVMGNKKLIVVPHQEGPKFEYYDLKKDPKELTNLADSADFSEMKGKLMEWIDRDRENWSKPAPEHSKVDVNVLKSLGYL